MGDWPAGHAREIHERLDSTHAEALRRAASEPGPLWIMARAQSAARGRRGRAWSTGRGDFAASLMMTPAGGAAEAALRSFVAALALRDALVELTGRPELFSLKWPNDVLLGGRKLAGILLETAGPPMRLAVGFGVNLVAAPDPRDLEESAMTPISLKAGTGLTIAPEALLDRLAPAFARWDARLTAEGFAPVRAAWLEAAADLGQPVVARMPGRSLAGRFETIDAGGALVVATAAGRVAVPAGDVFFGAAAGPGDVPSDPPAPPGPDRPPSEPPVPAEPDLPGDPGGPEEPDLPPEQPPVIDPPGPDVPPETPPVNDPPGTDVPTESPPVYDPPGTDVPTEIPPMPPTELPPGGPAEVPQQARRAAGD